MTTSVITRVQEILNSDESLKLLYDPPIDGPREGQFHSLEKSSLHQNVLDYLKEQFPDGLYTHQHEAIESILAGHNTVVATRTSSGKSLIYSLPVCHTLCEAPDSTALFLYPQKALANDQLLKLQEIICGIENLNALQEANANFVCRYDGSVPSASRKELRDTAQVVLSNPDMLHLAILNNHDSQWSRFFQRLKYVVIDECHEYRGIFGTNVAFVLRRLRQICEYHGSSPRFIATSATVQDPKGHMELLTGESFHCVDSDRDGSQQGRRKFWMVRGEDHFYDAGRKLGKKLADEGMTCLVFCPSRSSAERMLGRATKPEDQSHTRVYRSGLSTFQREEIETGLRTKDVKLVYSTSALELGIDIGEIDVVVCVGLPHSMMSFWQRFGRAARGGRDGAAILIPAETPIDSYYANHPDQLFERETEPLVLSMHNARVAYQHYACAAQEIGGDESQLLIATLGDELGKINKLRNEGKLNQEIFYVNDPQVEVNLRNGGEKPYKLFVNDVEIGEIDDLHLLRECYTNGIYRHGGRSYRVKNVLHGKKKIRLSQEFSRHETKGIIQKKIKVRNLYRKADYHKVCVTTAAIDVTEYLVCVSEQDPSGNTVMTWPGSAGMKPHRLPTEGTMLCFAEEFWDFLSYKLWVSPNSALLGVERLFYSMFPTISGPCDTQDFAAAIDRTNKNEAFIILYDNVYDGVELTDKAFDLMPELVDKSLERVASCQCNDDTGCFRCVANPRNDDRTSKTATVHLLKAIQEIFNTLTPAIIDYRDRIVRYEDRVVATCTACGHPLMATSRFCSECGNKIVENSL
ncbi:MAG: DEAD/DEAH box helicase [Planctomycetaceae bacterium]|nr:DEAD/DEAH box helicase [Planctomycetaceae bacterium]